METKVSTKPRLISCHAFYTIFILSSIFQSSTSFNIQEAKYGEIFTGGESGSQFGFSITFHENNQGKWLLVGAPKQLEETLSSKESFPKRKDGAVYVCSLQENMARNSTCSKIKLNAKKTEEIVYSCDFESCAVEQLTTDEFDWTRTNKKTASDNTGPMRDHTFENSTSGEKGYYMFIEASLASKPAGLSGISAIVVTPVQKGTLGDCLRFWYHMYGDDIETLNVYVRSNDTGMIMIWSKDGNQGNKWLEAYVTVISEQPYQILFEGLKKGWMGDIGIDDLKIVKGQCPEDIDMSGQSVGAALTRNPKTGEVLTCAPTWRYNCGDQIHSSGACYLFDRDLSYDTTSILTPCRTQICSTGLVDLVFLIDSSHSVSNFDFSNIKLWLRNVVSSLPINSNYIQVGVMVYTHTAKVAFHLNKYKRVEDIREAVDNMTFTGGNTKTGKAIDAARKEMFVVEHGMRPDAKHVVIVMTDGKSQDNVTGPSQRAKDKGITMFAIGVSNANEAELRAISTDPNKYLFTINDYSALSEIKKALQDSIAALESYGTGSTRAQGQAGLSATFYGDIAIMGAPGLDGWSGGYSSYYQNKNSSDFFSRELTTFQQLLNFEAEKRDTDVHQMVQEDYYGTEGLARSPTVRPNRVSSHITARTKIISDVISSVNKKVSKNTEPTTNLTLPSVSGTTFLPTVDTGSDSLVETTIGHSRKKRNTKMLGAHHVNKNVNTFETDTSESSEFHRRPKDPNGLVKYFTETGTTTNTGQFAVVDNKGSAKSRSKRNTNTVPSNRNAQLEDSLVLSRDEDVATLHSDAYFGYSITTGKFMDENRTDLAFGAPRSRSFGAVFIVKQSKSRGRDNPPRLVGRFQSKQMGSYFGFSLCAADLNGDGFDELVVGAPLWIGKQADEGRVFVYVSEFNKVSKKLKRKEVTLSGDNKANYRFGFSCANPGDLNKDGYDDVIIGAPTNSVDKSGSVFVYYGSRNFADADKVFQAIRASQRQERLGYFGFSLDASLDIDYNGYNDLAIGVPGDDKVMVLLSRPVIHIDVQFYANPSVLNLTNAGVESINRAVVCAGNDTNICTKLTACFSVSGLNIPDNITISYELHPDKHFLEGTQPRGRLIESIGQIQLKSNSRASCQDFVMLIKLPVRFQLVPMVIELKYRLSSEMPSTSKSAVIDVFDAKPKSTIISFAKACLNSTCLSDLQLSCAIMRDGIFDQSSLVIGYDRRITMSVNLTNQIDAAYDVELDLHFMPSLYFIQAVPLLSNGKRCFERATESNWIKKKRDTELGYTAARDDLGSKQLKLVYKDSVMKQGEECSMKLQFGMLDFFMGGNINFTFRARSNSVELQPSNSLCQVNTFVNMKTQLMLKGKSEDDSMTFLDSGSENRTSVEDIGPLLTHVYYAVNNGPSMLPNATLKVHWPTKTPSGHGVLYLVNATCQPSEACVCHDLHSLIDPFPINATTFKYHPNQKTVSFGQFVGPNNMKNDENTSLSFVDVAIDCNSKSKMTLCQNLHCDIHNLQHSKGVTLQLDFRLWKDTFLKGKAWRASIITEANMWTGLSPFLVDADGKSNTTLTAKIETEAFNGNFTTSVDDETNQKGYWLTILIAVFGGFAFLIFLMLLLARFGFFKSKYKEHMQDELQWTNSYKYTVARQQEADAFRNEEATNEESKPRLSTFQRRQTQHPVL